LGQLTRDIIVLPKGEVVAGSIGLHLFSVPVKKVLNTCIQTNTKIPRPFASDNFQSNIENYPPSNKYFWKMKILPQNLLETAGPSANSLTPETLILARIQKTCC
jgi:hypothetical protein